MAVLASQEMNMTKLPRFDTLKGQPTLKWGNRWTDAPTITMLETCPDCEGEGTVGQEVPGGRWNSYYGTWEPDEHQVPCETCGGEQGHSRHEPDIKGMGYVETARCGICGLPNEESFTDLGEGWCECDEDLIASLVASDADFQNLLNRLSDVTYGFWDRFGMRHSPSIHGLGWNHLHRFAAIHGSKVEYEENYVATCLALKNVSGCGDVDIVLFCDPEEA